MDEPLTSIDARLRRLARHERLAVLADLDGTLIPFARNVDETTLDDDVATDLVRLRELGVAVAIVTGRSKKDVEPLRAKVPGAWWFAEHGAWRHDGVSWRAPGASVADLDDLVRAVEALVASVPGGRVERKTLSVCVHWRGVAEPRRSELIAAASLATDEWLESQPDHERIAGAEMLEVRPIGNHKGVAVGWVRERLTEAAFLAIGDDRTDEDMFRALSGDDIAIMVGAEASWRAHAHARVQDVDEARALLRWLIGARGLAAVSSPPVREIVHPVPPAHAAPLLVISNRMPTVGPETRAREVGGLVAALEPAMREHGGVWLGWSGEEQQAIELAIDTTSSPIRATFDFLPEWRRSFYGGLCNQALWPMLHGFPGRLRYADEEWARYLEANETYARLAVELAAPDATVWIHDYHLLLVAETMRRLGHRGPIGLFLHVPFPAREVFETFPWANALLRGMLAHDLIGFHTARYVANFSSAVAQHLDVDIGGTQLLHLPIGIEPARFRHDPQRSTCPEVDGLRANLGDRRLLLGVDRLDYSKGVPERLEAYERLLERHPRWRRSVSFVQVSVPSRADVPEYAQLRARVENLVGRINGRFGDADWVPVRYLYRSYGADVLGDLYRAADVAVVTPLRDGMNLVAKEFVAAQDPANPGVLVLSKFAGAADELRAAVLTNPFHRDGLADDLDRALAMPAEERRARHRELLEAVEATTSMGWAAQFLDSLRRAHARLPGSP